MVIYFQLYGLPTNAQLAEDLTAAEAWATVDNVEVEVGGQVIDKQYGHWMQVWTDLSLGDKSALYYDCLAATAGGAGGGVS